MKKSLTDEESEKLREFIKSKFAKVSNEDITSIITNQDYREGFFLGIDLFLNKLKDESK